MSIPEIEKYLEMLDCQSKISQMYKAEDTVLEVPWVARIEKRPLK